jgi:hypothetical protein
MSPNREATDREDLHRLGEARQRADALALQVESTLRALGRRVPEDVRTRAAALIVDTQKALSAGAQRDRLRLLASRLEEVRRILPAVAGGAGTELWGGVRRTPAAMS